MSTTSRRRRILNDGVRAAGEENPRPLPTEGASDVSRYAANEQSVSFAVARGVLPHRRRAILGVATLGLLATGGLLAAGHYQSEITSALGIDALPAIDLASHNALARWMASSALLLVAGLSLLVFGLRRHRSDDLRGRYRWWSFAAVAALMGSVCITTGLHRSFALAVASQTGWAPATGPAVWWIVPAMLLLGAVMVRTVLDLKHCVPACIAAIVALLLGGGMVATEAGVLPSAAAPWSVLISHGCALGGLTALTASLLFYCRRIVLEANGTVSAPVQTPVVKEKKESSAQELTPGTKVERKPQPKSQTKKPAPKLAESTAAAETKPAAKRRQKAKAAETPKPAVTQWTDGSDGGDDDYGDQPRRKLSKAERKRLRKMKAQQGRAA